jgi:hypothetical protein
MKSQQRPEQLFTTADASALGISKRRLTKLADQRLTRGVYTSGANGDALIHRAKAVLLAAGERTVISHYTAAKLLGGVVPLHPDIHVTTPGSKRIQRAGVVAHRTIRPIRARMFRGLPMTTGAQTFVDLASTLDLVELVVLGDSLAKAGIVTLPELRSAASEWRGAGAARARQAAGLVRADVESPMESRLRLLIIFAGLPEPVIDHHLYDDDGSLVCRLDLAYLECRVGIEYDGRHHAESPGQWRHDIARREYLDGHHWRLVIVIGSEFYSDPAGILDRIVTAVRHNGMTIPDPNTRWRRYFRSAA